jgi:hypothetical protein
MRAAGPSAEEEKAGRIAAMAASKTPAMRIAAGALLLKIVHALFY